jgi:hypothetical protein
MHIWSPFTWSLRTFKVNAWDPFGASVNLQGSLDWTWDTKGRTLRPRSIGAVRSRTLEILILNPFIFHSEQEHDAED